MSWQGSDLTARADAPLEKTGNITAEPMSVKGTKQPVVTSPKPCIYLEPRQRLESAKVRKPTKRRSAPVGHLAEKSKALRKCTMSKLVHISAQGNRLAWWDELDQLDGNASDPKSIQVYEAESEMRPTGLLDAHGQPLFRITKRTPIGFRWSEADD